MKRGMVRIFFTVLSISLLLSGCCDKVSTEINIYFPNQIWQTLIPIDTCFEITNLKKTYEIKVALEVVDGFYLDEIPLEIVITSPSGQQNIIGKTLVIKLDDKYIGEVIGDIWTTSLTLYPFKQFSETGTYSVQILNRTQYYELSKVKSLSFEIQPVKEPKEKKRKNHGTH